jgi:hypothetical protein
MILKKYIFVAFWLVSLLELASQELSFSAGITDKGAALQKVAEDSTYDNTIVIDSVFRLGFECRHYGDSIVLRWVPGSQVLWKQWGRCGYNIERKKIKKGNVFYDETFELLTPAAILPLPLEAWEQLIRYDSLYLPVAAECLYGKMANQWNNNMDMKDIGLLAEEAQMRFGLAMFSADMSPLTAQCLGLRFNDKDIEKEVGYIYRILPDQRCEQVYSTDTVYFYVEYVENHNALPAPEIFGEEQANYVSIFWDVLQAPFPYTAYFIEVKRPDSNRFEKIQNEPFVYGQARQLELSEKAYLYCIDSLPRLYEKNQYRMFAIDLFGDRSSYSNILELQTRDFEAPAPPRFISVESYESKHILLTWSKELREPDLKGFILEKSQSIDGPYTLITDTLLDPIMISFLDTLPSVLFPHFYRIGAVDTAGNIAYSQPGYGFLNDTIPPHQPVGLNGFIDSAGFVHLHWSLNKDLDIQGYRVYISNQLDYEFQNMTGFVVHDTMYSFHTSINTSSKFIYAYIVAVDLRFHHSIPSDTITLIKPDTIPPSTPVLARLSAVEKGVLVEFYPTNSADVRSHHIWRKEWNTDMDFSKVASIEGLQASYFVDSTLTNGKTYSYAVSAEDEFGNISAKCVPHKITWYLNSSIPTPKIDQLMFDSKSRQLKIQCELLEKDGLSHLIIYRNINKNALKTYKTFEINDGIIWDSDLQRKGQYYYAVQLVYKNGSKSPISELVSIAVE